MADPIELAGFITQVGEYVLGRLGFDMTAGRREDRHGTDEHPARRSPDVAAAGGDLR